MRLSHLMVLLRRETIGVSGEVVRGWSKIAEAVQLVIHPIYVVRSVRNFRPRSNMGLGVRRLVTKVRSRLPPIRASVVPRQSQSTWACDQNPDFPHATIDPISYEAEYPFDEGMPGEVPMCGRPIERMWYAISAVLLGDNGTGQVFDDSYTRSSQELTRVN